MNHFAFYRSLRDAERESQTQNHTLRFVRTLPAQARVQRLKRVEAVILAVAAVGLLVLVTEPIWSTLF